YKLFAARARTVISHGERGGAEQDERGGSVGRAFAAQLQEPVPPDRAERAPETLERARRALHSPLLVLPAGAAHERHQRRVAEPDAQRAGNQQKEEDGE